MRCPVASSKPPPGGMGSQTGITFDRFVRACVVIKSLTEGFQRFDTVGVQEDMGIAMKKPYLLNNPSSL